MAFPFVAAAILGSSIIGGAVSAKGQRDANKASVEEAEKNRQFQQENSDTAHQREIADLRAAGLNPILSAKYGGASTPSGSVADIKSETEGLADDFQNGVNSAVDAVRAKREIDLIEAQADKTRAETEAIKRENEQLKESTTRDPFWYRDVKKGINKGSSALGETYYGLRNKIIIKNMQKNPKAKKTGWRKNIPIQFYQH